jgi:hypothetical protein
VTDQGTFAGVRPITWPRAAIGAALIFVLMIVFLVVVPSQFVTSDPSQLTKIATIVYIAAFFGLAAWLIAAWQNRGQAVPQPVTEKVSVFGRPMRKGPGFAAFADKGVPTSSLQPIQARFDRTEPAEDASSFGRPMKKRSQ